MLISDLIIIKMGHLGFLSRLFDYSELKVQIAAFWGMISSILLSIPEQFMGISASLFVLLFIIMITDYITGLRASKKEGKTFISKKGLGWVFKLGSYIVFLSVSFHIRKEIILNEVEFLVWPMKLIHFYILIHIFYWELKSVDENFERLGYSIRILKILDVLFLSIKESIAKKIKNV